MYMTDHIKENGIWDARQLKAVEEVLDTDSRLTYHRLMRSGRNNWNLLSRGL